MILFDAEAGCYRHWRLSIDGDVAVLALDVDEDGGLGDGYRLKLNSYDLGVDIELADIVQRLRFEHPEVGGVVLTSGNDRVFSAGANIQMLALASHAEKVNFCKFTNETRNAIEDSTANSGQRWVAALNGSASGGGYELALATDHIILVDDGSATVGLPEVALLGVLPGTGGLTRLVDKRGVRRDLADVVSTSAQGVRGQRALEWGLVDEVVPRARLNDVARARAAEGTVASQRRRGTGGGPPGVTLEPLEREISDERIAYPHLTADLDRDQGVVTVTIRAPGGGGASSPEGAAGEGGWPLACCRQLDDVILLLRTNLPDLGVWLLRTEGDLGAVVAADDALLASSDWLAREVILYWKRTLKRLETTSRSLIALVDQGSCFAGSLLEVALAADRIYMLAGRAAGREDVPDAAVALTSMNFGPLPMGNGLTRLQSRFLTRP
ncbi:MAG TPA: enoyl-CoA hydratase-related protein, partial [Acidimicrobiales bacterium]|nr:enoyl-CoA hydratase-related protein [Acidimicrobiales bacterium]